MPHHFNYDRVKGPRKIVIVGTGNISDVAYEFIRHDSPYEVVAFGAERDRLTSRTHKGLPLLPFEEIEEVYPPDQFGMFVSIGYGKLNGIRKRLCDEARRKGYDLVSYVSSQAFIWHNVEIGDNAFILENNVIQPFCKIGNGVTLWSGNHVGHGTRIRDYCYIASHVVVSGFVDIGESCFVGVNATFADNIKVGKNCLVGAGAMILRSTEESKVFGIRNTPPREYSELSPEAQEMFRPTED